MSKYMCNKCGNDADNKDDECPICNGDWGQDEDDMLIKRKKKSLLEDD